jgi:hypothetical protein
MGRKNIPVPVCKKKNKRKKKKRKNSKLKSTRTYQSRASCDLIFNLPAYYRIAQHHPFQDGL